MLLCTEAVKKALRKIHQMVIGQQKIQSISIKIYEKYSNNPNLNYALCI